MYPLYSRAFVSRNECGGRSISYTLGVDVYDETTHFNADGELIGVAVHPSAYPCHHIRNVYGMECRSEPDTTFRVECGMYLDEAGS